MAYSITLLCAETQYVIPLQDTLYIILYICGYIKLGSVLLYHIKRVKFVSINLDKIR